ncbi:MAG: sigma-70 family RNA polymerase sigma factor [Gammaproteobacteria bacterium]
MVTDATDKELIHLYLQGEHSAFDALMLRHQPRVKHLVSCHVQDPNLISDITQDVFVQVLRYLAQFHGNSGFYTWVYRITINIINNHLKKRSTEVLHMDYSFAESHLDQTQLHNDIGPEQITIYTELIHGLTGVLNHMPTDLSLTILLRSVTGLNYTDIAAIMDCPIGTVRSRLFHARAMILAVVRVAI